MENFDFEQSKRIFSIYARMIGAQRSKQGYPSYLTYNPAPGTFHWYAYCSGSRVTVGPGYFRLTKTGQIAVLVHEILHIKYPPPKKRSKKGRHIHVHTGRWKQAALKWGAKSHIQFEHILPQWKAHPYGKNPTPPEGCHCARCDTSKCNHQSFGRRLESDGVWKCSRCGRIPSEQPKTIIAIPTIEPGVLIA